MAVFTQSFSSFHSSPTKTNQDFVGRSMLRPCSSLGAHQEGEPKSTFLSSSSPSAGPSYPPASAPMCPDRQQRQAERGIQGLSQASEGSRQRYKQSAGRAIYLNGPSGAGKTTITKILQEKSEDQVWLSVGIDLLIREILPTKCFLSAGPPTSPSPSSPPPPPSAKCESDSLVTSPGGPVESDDFFWDSWKDPEGVWVPRLRMGPRAARAWEGLLAATAALLSSGNDVIIDDVAFLGPQMVDRWRAVLSPFHCLFVEVRCSLEVLEERESRRPDRMPRHARGQFYTVHEQTLKDSGGSLVRVLPPYDVTVDTSATTPTEVADRILAEVKKRWVETD
uniref:Uncharacterized protein n=1 Tax=Chromera velia CCMP2878 TaxID=1169474 RepID=A0A0G4IAW8_9ALVE|eukprot:Cvel_12578.t1-p1 / transcript=Cvel_12578.t1 / gene=Cvel_12578 / organism=Chromera_velia_CCMP2878 / gene_product=hypothetical protein / transcript_product=hypothetical protein / location=Cvel_scaffold828:47887-49954(-) / protein_length=335 / sequence_SO=supercontig / SO=protein_coding / is_pseudo=false